MGPVELITILVEIPPESISLNLALSSGNRRLLKRFEGVPL
jgi:hypothetical protein